MSLGVTGMGLTCSVGRNVRDACASIRSGLVRPQELDYFDLLDPETQEPLPLVGHPIRGVTEGFSGVGLWMRLAERCIAEALSDAGITRDSQSPTWARTAFVAVTPYIDDARFYGQGEEELELLLPAYALPLIRRSGLPINEANVGLVAAGHAGFITALVRTSQLVGKTLERAIVVAVDSYLDVLTLEWLAGQSRLKSPESPLGLMPGEAGVALVIEDESACQRRGGSVAARLSAACMARESANLESTDVNRGIGLAEAIDRALSSAKESTPFAGDIVADLNGEEWRSRELFGALQRLEGRIDDEVRIVAPANSTGDTGAASAGVSICAAVRAHQRGYARRPRTLVLGSSDRGDVGAALISATTE